ncbi:MULTISPECIES: carbon-nitrogen hydrolase family protein [unclassified Francisella]|uniref:carbon-nitrogen hydrolase family protein n=1 Tax=unclassified Francisella TaxID=2610885 RepID=UPI002E32EF84|nr:MULTISPECIES: carbon-nitrogen hydrolase family protein [unclassified Francisella]MED7820224.1 carbon-nitrogen hydrolase family protein [Francisella sp. 19S2-4]MED7831078.1 carbon-nitrogen hydrolase family protein [Francisella sp. 19S2-10]
MKKLKVACVQAHSIYGDVEKTLKKASILIKEASSNGADVVVFPEVFLGGYPRGMNFGNSVGVRTIKGRNDFVKYHSQAIKVPGCQTAKLASLAKRYAIDLIIGVLEVDSCNVLGTIYCSMLIFNNNGKLIHKHRKIKPTASERLIWGEGDIQTVKVVETNDTKIGGLICWENKMPLLRNHLYEQGVQLYVAPTADGRDSWMTSMQHIAQEGGCFVISSNQYAKIDDIYSCEIHKQLSICENDKDQNDNLYSGGSLICNPAGEIIAGPLRGQEGILYADINPEEITKAKFDFDVVGHYRCALTKNNTLEEI